jgi:hypothetical protein
LIISYSNSEHFHGDVVSYSSLSGLLIVNVTDISTPTGIFSIWTTNLDGAAGGDGTSGTSGNNGTSGESGTSGTSGTSGENGTSGESGTSGTSGTSGEAGTSGTSGLTGAPGNSYGIMTFAHSEFNPVDATLYYFGQIGTIVPETSSKQRHQYISLFTGQISQASLVAKFTLGSIENSTLTVANVTQGTSSVISSSVQYYTGPSATLITESLQTLVIPSGWSQVNVSFPNTYAGFAITGVAPFAANLDTLTFDASLYSALSVSFDTAKFGTGADGPLRLSYSLDGGSSWTVVGNGATPTSATYLSSTLNVPVTSSTMRLRWDMTQTVNSAKRLRNVVVNGTSNIDGSASLINLSSPLNVTEGDLLEMRWQTPTWSTNPTSVVNIVNLKINS